MVVKKALTLPELFVLIVIILALFAILVPTYIRFREESRRTTCADNLRRIGVSLHQYAQSSRDWLPASGPFANTCSDAKMPAHTHHTQDLWLRPFSSGVYAGFVPDFLGDGRVMFCPSGKNLAAASANIPCVFALSDIYVYPAFDENGKANTPLPGYALEDLVGSYSIITNNPAYDQQSGRVVSKADDSPDLVVAGEFCGGPQTLWFTKSHDGWLGNASCNHYASRRGSNWKLDVQNELCLSGKVEAKTPTDLIYEALFNPQSSKYRHYY